MFIVSLVVCILLNVITVQPIYGADDSVHNLTKKGQAEFNSRIDTNTPIYSDSFTHNKNATTQNDTKSVGNASSGGHNRSVTKTSVDLAPPSVSGSSSTNSSSNVKINPAKNSNTNANASATPVQNAAFFPLDPSVVKKLTESNQKPAAAVSSTTTSTTLSANATTTKTTTTTTTTSKPTTTTTSAPKKPLITYAVEDIPGLLKAAESQPQQGYPIEEAGNYGPLSLQSSETITYPSDKSNQPNFIMTMIGIIVVIPLIIVVSNCAVRKVRDIWSKRKYRRMNYLIEDMYN